MSFEDFRQQIAPGVRQWSRQIICHSGKQQIQIIEVQPGQKQLFFEAGLTSKKVIGMEKTTEQAAAVCQTGHRVIAAVNADFYNMVNGLPLNLMIHQGQLLTAPNHKTAIGFKDSGKAIIGIPELSVKVKINHHVYTDPCTVTVNKDRREDQLVLYTENFAERTGTDDDGIEGLIEMDEGKVQSGCSVKGTVLKLVEGKGNNPIKKGQIVFSGSGMAAKWLRQNVKVGDQVECSFVLAGEWADVTEAVGGNRLLVDNGLICENAEAAGDTIAPRTAVGIKQDGSIFLVVVDGRQPGYSEGVTIKELAELMVKLEAVKALNFDGGGSSTMLVRQPGDLRATIVNRPSDGAEREVANSLLLISKEEAGSLSQLVIRPQHLIILAGSKHTFMAKGIDASYQPHPIEEEITWSVEGNIGEIMGQGQLIAGSEPGEGFISAASAGVTGRTGKIKVVNQLTELAFPQQEITIDHGMVYQLDVLAFYKGKKVNFDPACLEWKFAGTVGKIDPSGIFTAFAQSGQGTVTVSYGQVSASLKVEVGKEPFLLEDFENGIDNWEIKGDRCTAINLAVATSPTDPVRFGHHALRIDYNFLNQKGISGVYAFPKQMVALEGYPNKIAMWVYGDGQGHWLRAQLRDGKDQAFAIDYTDNKQGVDWKGWQYVEAELPKGRPLPLKMEIPFRYLATNDERKTTGTLYIDQIRAVYGETKCSE